MPKVLRTKCSFMDKGPGPSTKVVWGHCGPVRFSLTDVSPRKAGRGKGTFICEAYAPKGGSLYRKSPPVLKKGVKLTGTRHAAAKLCAAYAANFWLHHLKHVGLAGR